MDFLDGGGAATGAGPVFSVVSVVSATALMMMSLLLDWKCGSRFEKKRRLLDLDALASLTFLISDMADLERAGWIFCKFQCTTYCWSPVAGVVVDDDDDGGGDMLRAPTAISTARSTLRF